DDDVIDQPAFEAASPSPDRDLDPVLLNISAGCEEQPTARHRADQPILPPLIESLPVRCFAGLDPRLAEDAVLEAALSLVGARCVPHPGDVGPREPADRRIERREVEADGTAVSCQCGCPPLAGLKQGRLVVLLDHAVAALAEVLRRIGLAFFPTKPLEAQPLAMTAMRAGDEEAALVGRLVLALDPRDAVDRRRRRQEDLRPPREGTRAGLGERDGISFLFGRTRIGIDLVQKQ